MTFSHRRVIELIQSEFVPVWESVAPVRTATFDLGDGKKITGTTGGETAIFFCTPEGWVFDILPALHSPQAVYEHAREALGIYRIVRQSRTLELGITMYHTIHSFGSARREEDERRTFLRQRWIRPTDPASGHLARMAGSKAGLADEAESVVVVEPGGAAFYRTQVHDLLGAWELSTPLDLRRYVFEKILNEPLDDRGEFTYSFDIPRPFSLRTSPGDADVEENR